jgi:transcription initiation factor TFIIIB Brf1 subunit/transcription initiation factor TFIIB
MTEVNEISCDNCVDIDVNDFIENNGYLTCTGCGSVIKSVISDLAEWNNYSDSTGSMTNNSRCGNSVKSTDINPYNTTSGSSFIPKGVKNVCIKEGKVIKYDISRIHIQNNTNHLQKSFMIVENFLDNITIDKYPRRIVLTAKTLWAEIMKSKKITRAGVRKGLIACCLYYACIYHDCTRSPIEICNDFSMIDTKQFNKGDKEFKEIFENIPKWSQLLTKTSNSDDYFSRFCSMLELEHIIKENTSFNLSKECKEFYEQIKDKLIGLFPKSIACGIIYYILKKNNENVSKTKLSKCLGICNPTLTKTLTVIYQVSS